MGKYQKKPAKIDAVQWTGDNLDACRALLTAGGYGVIEVDHGRLIVDRLEGRMVCPVGHWIIRGAKGEIYSCKDSVFKLTYEPAEDAR